MAPRTRSPVIAIVLALLAGASQAADETAQVQTPARSLDATVEMSGAVVAAGIGYEWGHGTLSYHGRDFRFCIHGLSVGDVGAADLKATGLVFNLNHLHDFAGKYFAASMGVALVGGESAAVLKNQHGVTMQLETKIKGLRFNIAAAGLRISLARHNECGH